MRLRPPIAQSLNFEVSIMIKWSFISNQNGEIKGINDSGVATFRGTPLKSLAREICQNSLDANVDETPVVIEFHVFDIPVKNIPGADELQDAFMRSLKYWGGQKTSQTRDFFEAALKEYEKETVSVLRISDFNTKGLRGSREIKDTDWTNLTKSSGVSDKHGTAGGSYGIGKYATFACSKFSTVFYSTYDINNEQAYQGISRIVTFERADGEATTGLGFYGEDKNKPVYNQLNLDPVFSRKLEQFGTDIYVLAFAQAQIDWKREIILSILDSFLVAFWKNKLRVFVEGVEISKETLPELMRDYKDSVDSYVISYYSVLTSLETKWFIDPNFNGLGEIKLGILLLDDATRRVAMVRQTGMKIKDQGGISGYIPFMGVMLIEGDEINTKLRLIENPQHTEWEPKRSPNEEKAKALLRSLNSYMKKKVDECAMLGEETEIDAIGLGELLPDNFDGDTSKSHDEGINDNTESIESKDVRPKRGKSVTHADPEAVEGKTIDGDDGNGWFHTNPKPVNPDPDPRPPMPVDVVPGGKTKILQPKYIKLDKFVFISPNKTEGKFIINLIPGEEAKNGKLELFISGEIYSFPATIRKAGILGKGDLKFDKNVIQGIDFEKGKQLRISLELDVRDYCALEVRAYAN